MEQGLITFFNVSECGFYRMRKGSKSEHIEGSLKETISLLDGWIRGRDVELTIPWDPTHHPTRAKIYSKNSYVDSKTGDSVFVFWKQFADNSGNVKGLLGKSKVGAEGKDTHKVKVEVKGDSVLLGDPMYYWFIPKYNLIASIKFPHSLADTDSALLYIKNCIDLRIEVSRKVTSQSQRFNQFSGNTITRKNISYKSEDGKYSLKFKIDASMKELSLKDASFDQLAKEISHIVVRETITSKVKVQEDKHVVFKVWDKITKANKYKEMSKQVEVTSSEMIEGAELEDMLKTYNDVILNKQEWNNVGFKTNGVDSPTKWFDKYIDRKHILVPQEHKQDDIYFPAEKIFTEILRERDSLLSFVVDDEIEAIIKEA